MDTVVVLRRRMSTKPGGHDPGAATGYEYWEYWWERPAGLFWNLDEALRWFGVPADLLSDLLMYFGPSSREYRALNQLAFSACERVRLRVRVADAPPGWIPPTGWETISEPRDEYLHLWRVVRSPDAQALQAAVDAASKAVEHWRRYGGWL